MGTKSPVNEEKLKKELLKKFARGAVKVIFLKNLIYKDKEISRRDKMAQRATVDEVKIYLPVFDGQGYQMWRKRMITFLRMKDCKKVVIGERENEEEAIWKRLELKAVNYTDLQN